MDFTRLFIRRRAGRAGWLDSMWITLARSADEPAHEAIIGIQALFRGCGLPGSSNGDDAAIRSMAALYQKAFAMPFLWNLYH